MPVNIFTTIDDPSATGAGGTVANGINDAGLVMGAYFDATGEHGFLLSGGSFTTIDVSFGGPSSATEALGINNAGTVVGLFRNASGNHGFMRFSGSGVTARFDGPAGSPSTAQARSSGHTSTPPANTASSVAAAAASSR